MSIHDPGRAALRRSLRVAVVTPFGFAISELLDVGPQASVMVAFGTFSLLAMADFGGPPRRRAAAYLGATAVGSALIAIATPLAGEAVVGAAITLPIAFGIRFSGNLGEQAKAAVTPLTLAFVLAIALEAPPGALEDRLIGWIGGGLLATAAALLLWPHYERPALLRSLSAVVDRLAEAVALPASAAARAAGVAALREVRGATEGRPLLSSGRLADELAGRRVIGDLSRIEDVLPLEDGGLATGVALREQVALTLRATAAMLRADGAEPSLIELERRRVAHRQALAVEAQRRLRAGSGSADVLGWLDRSFGLRVSSYAALSVGANAMLLSGRLPPAADRFELAPALAVEPRRGASWRSLVAIARARLRPGSTRLRDAIRGGVGIALAVLVAGIADVSHGFWVVLATLMVLKSNALSTERTARAAIGGTTLGFLLATPLMLALGTGGAGLWIALPPVAFLAAYASPTLGVVAGQAGFALFVVILFNLVDPVGWEVGLVRLETVAIGAGVSIVAGLLLWPRGALAAVARSAAGGLRAAADYLDALSLEGSARPLPAGAEGLAVTEAMVGTLDAISQHLSEPGLHLRPEQAAALLDAPRLIRATRDGLGLLADLYPVTRGRRHRTSGAVSGSLSRSGRRPSRWRPRQAANDPRRRRRSRPPVRIATTPSRP